jgi:hypothetical protein
MATTLGEQYPAELEALRRRAAEMSEQLGIEIVIDHVGVKSGRVIACLKPADGSYVGTVYTAVTIKHRNSFWRGGNAA